MARQREYSMERRIFINILIEYYPFGGATDEQNTFKDLLEIPCWDV